MRTDPIQPVLDQIEASLEQMDLALRQSNSQLLLRASSDVQRFALALPQLLQQTRPGADKSTQQRVLQLAGALGLRREAVFRHTAMVQRALAALVPASQENATYAPAVGRLSRRPYGSVGRQSGEFRSLTA